MDRAWSSQLMLKNPCALIDRKNEYVETLVRRGATIGANATIVCGTEIGEYAFIGAGAVITRDVKPHAPMLGVPAKQVGWMCECGERLERLYQVKSTKCMVLKHSYCIDGL